MLMSHLGLILRQPVKCGVLIITAFMLISVKATAAPSLSASQLQQLQQLSPAQQKQLAKQYGIDLSTLQQNSVTDKSDGSATPAVPQRVTGEPLTSSSKQTSATDKKGEDSLTPFGYDFFAGQPLSTTVVDDLPLPNDYLIGAGDTLDIQVFGKENQQYQLTVKRDGSIHFPKYGPMPIAGYTFGEARDKIQAMFAERVIGVNVTVDIGAMRTMQVYLTGDIKQPGAYTVNGLTTITQALIASGGIKETGSLRAIQLKRDGKIVKTLDLYDLLLSGNSQDDIRLLKGDTLFVPARGPQVSVEGEVLRPAYYELTANSKNLGDAIAMAGGTLPQGYLSSVSVKRQTETGKKQFNLDLTTRQGRNFALKNGDQIVIAKSAGTLDNAIVLRGEVVRQGAFKYTPNLKLSDILNDPKRTLKPSADLNYALVVRERDANRNIDTYQFSINQIIADANSEQNITLQPKDQIFILSNGVDSEFWDDADINAETKQQQQQQQQNNSQALTTTAIDVETGAEIDLQQRKQAERFVDNITETVDEQKRTTREAELLPIIERLKDQATYDQTARVVEVSGAVKFPGVYPLSKNSTFNSLIHAAGGLAESAYLQQAEITRREIMNGKLTVRHYPVDVSAMLANNTKGFIVQPQDRINIKTKPNWHKNNTVELQGEVRFPGVYAFERGETLQDVIERAGGLTQFAYPKGAVFSRDRLKRQEQERLKMLNRQLQQEISSLALRRQTTSAQYTTSPSEALKLAEELQNAEAVGRMVISLPRALSGDQVANIMVEGGDKLYVPPKNPVISIMGEVQFSSNQLFEPGMTVSDYLERAGGTKQQADKDRIYVVRADGSVMLPNNSFWFSRNQKQLEPGDTIVVPIDTDYLDGLSTASTATQILYQLGVAWQAVKD